MENLPLLTETMRIMFASEKHVVRVDPNIFMCILQQCISRPEYHDDHVDNLSLLTETMIIIFTSEKHVVRAVPNNRCVCFTKMHI